MGRCLNPKQNILALHIAGVLGVERLDYWVGRIYEKKSSWLVSGCRILLFYFDRGALGMPRISPASLASGTHGWNL